MEMTRERNRRSETRRKVNERRGILENRVEVLHPEQVHLTSRSDDEDGHIMFSYLHAQRIVYSPSGTNTRLHGSDPCGSANTVVIIAMYSSNTESTNTTDADKHGTRATHDDSSADL